MQQLHEQTIAFIGAGNMSTAIIQGLIQAGFPAEQIIAANPTSQKLALLKEQFAIRITTNNLAAIAEANMVVLAVKPQKMAEVCQEIVEADISLNKILFISVAVGLTGAWIQQQLKQSVDLIRCMPNTPCLLGKGVSGLFSIQATKEQEQLVTALMEPTGLVVWVDNEEQVDLISTISGSGPAYFFAFMEAMVAQGVVSGFEPALVEKIVRQTALGASVMAIENQESLSQLRAKVTSKGGTTAAALASFEQQQLSSIISNAMLAAKQRANELANTLLDQQ